MTTLLLIAALALASVYGYWMMTKLDGFLSGRKNAGSASRRRAWKGMPPGKYASVLLHIILNHLSA